MVAQPTSVSTDYSMACHLKNPSGKRDAAWQLSLMGVDAVWIIQHPSRLHQWQGRGCDWQTLPTNSSVSFNGQLSSWPKSVVNDSLTLSH